MSTELSVVVPMYNEQQVLPLFAERLRAVLDGLLTTYEVVCVDDGSTDLTPALLTRLAREWPQVRVVRLRANAGHQAAISAGLQVAAGDYVVTLDADLQDPPEVLSDLLRTARREQVDVVYGIRSDRSADSAFKRVTARAFYAFIRAVSGTGAPVDAGDYRLMSRATVDAVNQLPQAGRVLRFVVPALGFPSAEVPYKRAPRAAGTSKYPLAKMLRLSADSVTGFSLLPLRLATYLGLGGAALIGLASIALVFAARTGSTIPGWTSTVLIVAGVGAVQLLCLGALGEYVGRMYTQMQGRPAYFVAYDSGPPSRHSDLDADVPVAVDDPLRRRQLR